MRAKLMPKGREKRVQMVEVKQEEVATNIAIE